MFSMGNDSDGEYEIPDELRDTEARGFAPQEIDASYETSYARLCRAHVARYMRGTQDYAQETNLTRRVSDWEDKLAPVLTEQKKT